MPSVYDSYYIIQCHRAQEVNPSKADNGAQPCLELSIRKPIQAQVVHQDISAVGAALLGALSSTICQVTSQWFELTTHMYFLVSVGARAIPCPADDVYDQLMTLQSESPVSRDSLCVSVRDAKRSHQVPIFHFAPDLLLYDASPFLTSIDRISFDAEPLYSSEYLNVHQGNWDGQLSTVVVLRSRQESDKLQIGINRRIIFRFFLYETLLLAHLSHPNVVSLSVFTLHPQSLVLEHCEYGSLEYLLARMATRRERLHPTLCFTLANDIATGMAYLHQNDVLHHRLSPRTVHLSPPVGFSIVPLRARVCGFGPLTQTIFEFDRHTEPLGSSSWRAPELFQGGYRRKVSPTRASDVYSFGLILYSLFTQSEPFAPFGFSTASVLEEFLISGGRPNITGDIPPTISKMITSCWDEVFDRRPSFATIVEQLQPLCSVLSPCPLPSALHSANEVTTELFASPDSSVPATDTFVDDFDLRQSWRQMPHPLLTDESIIRHLSSVLDPEQDNLDEPTDPASVLDQDED